MARMTSKDLTDIKKKLEEAQNDDTPYTLVTDDEIMVVGDPNKTEVKTHDYTVKFRFPESLLDSVPHDPDVKIVCGQFITDIEFKDVSVIPRNDLKIVGGIAQFLPFFYEITEDGNLEDRTTEELAQIVINMSDEVMDGIYNIVAAFLDIDNELKDRMLATSVLETLGDLIHDFPQVFNEADGFFG